MDRRMYVRTLPCAAACLLMVVFAACGDDHATGPQPTIAPVTIQLFAGNGQSASIGEAVPAPPSVRVTGAGGVPAPGITVHFAVTAGGGGVFLTTTRTNRDGIASAGRWTLGIGPGMNILEATVTGLGSVRFFATGESPFHITVRYIGPVAPQHREAVDSAVMRWRSVIIRDLESVRVAMGGGICFPQQPALNEMVDDLLLYVRFVSIDGVDGILGRAGPCLLRSQPGLPILGYLELDTDDLIEIEKVGALHDLVLHEIGHVLGFGTMWPEFRFISGAGGINPLYTGTNALDRYHRIGGAHAGVPVENTGTAGTRDSHWRESVFGNELMTGFLSGSGNPLSAVTIASLQDLGYTTSTGAADGYTLGIDARERSFGVNPIGISLEGREQIIAPRFTLTPTGTFQRIVW